MDNLKSNSPPLRALVCLLAAVLLLSSISPVIKYVFEESDLHPIGMAGLRVLIGFLFLLPTALVWDRSCAKTLRVADTMSLTLLGLLGVGSYAVAAWGLLHTSVTHYVLIYSLLPSLTAVFSYAFGRERVSACKVIGILVSFVGCAIALSNVAELGGGAGFGEGLVMLFTGMMAAHIVLSSGIAKHHRALSVNAWMFGGSSLVLSLVMVVLGVMGWPAPTQGHFSPLSIGLVAYVGIATAAVFVLRYLSLQTLTPMTVGVYHNLVPFCTILLAYAFLGEAISGATVIGGLSIIAGAELVRRQPAVAWPSGMLDRSTS